MKKIIAMMLSVMMILSMGIGVFADDTVNTGIIKEVVLKTEKVNDYSSDTEECISVVMTTSPATSYAVVMYTTIDGNYVEMTRVTPLKNAVANMYNANGLNAKIIISDGVSDNWEQTNSMNFTEDVVPTKIEVIEGTNVVGAYIISADDAIATSWAGLDGTVKAYDGSQNDKPANFDKAYDIVNEANNSKAPAEDFTFKFVPYSATDVDGDPVDVSTVAEAMTSAIKSGDESTTTRGTTTVNDVTYATLTAGFDTALTADDVMSVAVAIDATKLSLGVYTYEVTEIAGNTAGVTYTTEKLYLVATILRDETNGQHYVAAVHYEEENGLKEGQLVNKYEASSLSVNKQITGNMANMSDTFNVVVTFTAPAGTVVKEAITYTDGTAKTIATTDWTNNVATVTITLAHDETVTFQNIPYNVTYTVVENDYTTAGYDPAQYDFSDETNKKIDSADTDTVVITNNRGANVDTGISVDSIPYIAMLGVVALGGTGLVISKKRRSED